MTSQLEWFIFHIDKAENCQSIFSTSDKENEKNRSVIGSRVTAFDDAFNMTRISRQDLQVIVVHSILVSMMTQTSSIFICLQKVSVTTKNRVIFEWKLVAYARSENDTTDL